MTRQPVAPLVVDDVRFTATSRADRDRGLLAYAAFRLNGALQLDGIALRRTRDGRVALSFPCRRDRAGRRHPLVHPLTDAARRSIEVQVLAAYGLKTNEVRS
jgi:DNA-binding cell septation regulator SpoVG